MRRLALLAAAVLAVATLAAPAQASDGSSWSRVRNATAAYHDLGTAQAAGWNVLFHDVNGVSCILNDQGPGGMGYHYLNVGNIGSTNPLRPAALVYAPTASGGQRLAALEYIVVEPHQAVAPQVNGVDMMWMEPGNRYLGSTGFYALHVWLWDHNPGLPGEDMPPLYQPFNPKVTCCC